MSARDSFNETQSLFLYHLTLSYKYPDTANWSGAIYQIMEEHAEFLQSLGEKGAAGLCRQDSI